MYYLNKFYSLNKNNFSNIDNLFNNIKIYVFTAIIISLKFILDHKFNIHQLCTIIDIDYNVYEKTEIIILEGLKWNIFLDNFNYNEFKIQLEKNKD